MSTAPVTGFSPVVPFITKYQPLHIHEFEQLDPDTITIINSLIQMDNLNILFYGDSGSGKTSIINAIIREYYKNKHHYSENILILNSLKDQGIQYYRNDVKIFCQTCSLIPNKKKIKLLDREITYEIANQICSNISFHLFEDYTREVLRGVAGLKAANAILFTLNDQGYSVLDILDNYFLFVKYTSLFSEDVKYQITSLVCKYITIFHNIHEHDIELALFTNNVIKLVA